MAEKLKSFFKKKVKDQKFKQAGKGYRLNNPSPSTDVSTSRTADPPRRQEPNEQARLAGQAALARLEQASKPNPNKPKFNTSQYYIQQQVKRDLEQERLALTNQNISGSSKFEENSSENKISETHLMAVSGVYFQCPLISEEVLDKETWYEKIEEFLSAQLANDEAGLSACLIIRSCNEGEERINDCVKTLCKYLDNIRNDPSEKKFWKIRISNKIFQEKVKPLKGSLELLKAAGFDFEVLMHEEKEEEFLVWSPDRSNISNLTTLIDALNCTESVQLLLDRNVQVMLPIQATERSELPKEFYSLTAEDIKRLHIERSKAVERNEMLMTQAMREKYMKEKERKYQYTLIRIRFPDNKILQGTFSVSETLEEVFKFVKEHLANNEFPFDLIVTREKLSKTDYDKTLESLKLVPAVTLMFSWNISSNDEVPSQYLTDETLSLLQSI